MDYKYIEQLLERYWKCETTLEEEEILRAFFSQKEVPSGLVAYKDIFVYEHNEAKENVLDDSFDAKMLELAGEQSPVKARVIKMPQRLMPLFKAAAVVAIMLTLGNAAQVAFDHTPSGQAEAIAGQMQQHIGKHVAAADSMKVDTLKRTGHLSTDGSLMLK